MCVDPLIYVYGYFCVCMYGGGLSRFRQLLHSSGRLFCVATVRCGKTLVIHDNRVRRRYIKTLLFVCVDVFKTRFDTLKIPQKITLRF